MSRGLMTGYEELNLRCRIRISVYLQNLQNINFNYKNSIYYSQELTRTLMNNEIVNDSS